MNSSHATWGEAFQAYSNPRVIAMFFLGLAAGLPLLLVFSTLSAWLRDMEVSRSAIGFFGWIGITYSIKFFWAPVVDRLALPHFTGRIGQRRSWMLLGQIGIAVGLVGMSLVDPRQHLLYIAGFAVMVAFFSSTQDIAIDAFRIESAETEQQGAMSATYIFGYRVAMLMAGAGAFYIADNYSWQLAYWVMAGLMTVGMVTTLVVSEPDKVDLDDSQQVERRLHQQFHLTDESSSAKRLAIWFVDAVVSPFVEFFHRNGRFAILILLFIALFRLSDIVMGIMANPFYLDLGFSKSDIASVGKVFGFFMTIAGSFLGGLLVVRYGVFRPLLLGAVMVASTNLLFAQLALVGPDISWLAAVISADNLSGGLSNAAFIAYLSGLTNRAYTATQYALFSSLMTLPGKFMSGFSGVIVDASGYFDFFIYAALMGLPAIALAWLMMRHHQSENSAVG